MGLVVERLNSNIHKREEFNNRDSSIESFLKHRANKEQKLHISDTYVLVDESIKCSILGYFTLSNHSIILDAIPHNMSKKFPDYPSYGTVLLGRMGRNDTLTPAGFGKIILQESMIKSLDKGSFFALELHAKNQKLVEYYKKFKFILLPGSSRKHHMILPYDTLRSLIY